MTSAATTNRNPTDRNADATVHVAQLDDKVSDAVLWELMIQAGPVRHVYVPRDRITGNHYGYGFCEFNTALDAQYAAKVLNMVKLYSKPIRISQSTVDRRSQDVGANLFVGNLVEEVDEKLLHDAFSAFGTIIDAPYIMRDPLTNESKRYGFVKFSAFEQSDAAIAAMDGQYICNSPITVQYAFKKDGHSRERHGAQAERILAARAAEARRATNQDHTLRPHAMFSDRPASAKIPKLPVQPAVFPPGMPYGQPQSGHPLSGYPYPPQQYAPVGGHTPQWQRNSMPPQYAAAPLQSPYQVPLQSPYQAPLQSPYQAPLHQVPPPHPTRYAHQSPNSPHATQLGWNSNRQNRPEVGASSNGHRRDPHGRSSQDPWKDNGVVQGMARPVPDKRPPPAQ